MESVMSASPTPQFEIPNEIRAVAERSVDQAKVAFQQLMQAAEEAVSTLERGEKNQGGALDISKKAMTFAERNVLSAFELAQKIVHTKDIQELVRMQTDFLQSQMQALGEQVKDLSETVSKAATDSKKTLKIASLSS
jgi:phasin